MRVVVAWVLVGLCGGWVVLRVLGLERGYPLVPLVAFTPFVAAAAVALVVVVALLRQRGAAVVATVLAVVLVGMVAPRALGGPSDADGPELRVLSVNMHYGTGSVAELMALVRRERPDVVSVQELTPPLARELEAAGLGELLPEQVLHPGGRGAGIGLYSRVPLAVASAPGDRRNPLVIAGVAVEGAPPVEVAAVHPPPPLRRALPAWRRDLRALPSATPNGALRILAGDFNATLDHAELRRLLDTGYVDAADEVGAGLKGTWPRGRRFPPPVAIDHVLADARIGVRSFSVHAITGTDHRAVLAELVLPRG
jgi:endonuclease/exonuclease/phosphatase (EEP) superfamily protein YafD